MVYGALLDATGLVGPADVGLDAGSLEERIAAPAIKDSLRSSTQQALEAGVFGVPTFRCRKELFWGHDRLDQLAAHLDGRLRISTDQSASMEERPRGADRGGFSSLRNAR